MGRHRLCGHVRDDVRRRRAWSVAGGWGRHDQAGLDTQVDQAEADGAFVAAAGLAAAIFGALYGEFFGPTGVVPVLWLAPLEDPLRLLLVALALGAVLLGLAYAAGAVNRWREGGLKVALYAPSGIAGATVFVGLRDRGGRSCHQGRALLPVGAALAVLGIGLAVVGLFAEAGGGGQAVLQAAIGGFDLVVRMGSNVVSFARLAAFGMTHAALGWVVARRAGLVA